MRLPDRIRVRHMHRTTQWSCELVAALCAQGLDAYLDDDVFGDRGSAERQSKKYIILDIFDYRTLEESTFVVHVSHYNIFITWLTMDAALIASWDDLRRDRFAFQDGKRAFLGMWGLHEYAPSDPGVTPSAAAPHIGHLVRIATARTYEDLPAILPTLPAATQAYAAWAEGGRMEMLVRCTGDYDRDALRAQALAAYDRAIALDPSNAAYHLSRGIALGALARWSEALAACEHALDLIPNYAHASYHTGVVLRHLDRKDEALSALNRSLALDAYQEGAWRDQIQLLDEFGQHAFAAAARRQREIALEGTVAARFW